jgi:predicted dehydrogenase
VNHNRRLRWAVLGTGKFVTSVAIPAMKECLAAEVVGIASRSAVKAQAAAEQLALPKHYAGYEASLDDPAVDVIYNALPNDLHVEWSIRAAQAGKHVLCEKPIALTLDDCLKLIEVRDRSKVAIGEAFMIRHHSQWKRVLELVGNDLGTVRSVVSTFSYNNQDPANIRNQPEHGGGALWDIGCYLVLVSRMAFGSEPGSVYAAMDRDPNFGVDRLTSAVLTFSGGHAIFSCGTQMAPFQNVRVVGAAGRVEMLIPFNAPAHDRCAILIQRGKFPGGAVEMEEFQTNQYAAQADEFSAAIQANTPPATTLEDATCNVRVIEALFQSAREGKSIELQAYKGRAGELK